MLFNTLAYAWFLALVFLVAWALVKRKLALFLPWFFVAAYAAQHISLQSLAVTLVSFGLCLSLYRQVHGERISRRFASVVVLISYLAVSYQSLNDHQCDAIAYACSLLKIPQESWGWFKFIISPISLLIFIELLVSIRVRLLFILGASYVFYAHWDYRFLPIIWASSSLDWLLAHAIDRAKTQRSKRAWLVGTVIMNLGVLAFFKYFNFGLGLLNDARSFAELPALETSLSIALPIGISFFTFESMSYVIDVYRNELKPQKNYFEYLSFVAFFPHLVAGPIVRPRDLLPQLAGKPRFNAVEASEGLFLIAIGLLKKVAISDYLALNLVDRVFDAPNMYSSLETYAAVIGYALQIYCDFSGYTDIAIGSALLLGIRFPLNFNSPYKAVNIIDFWRRWHISLSTWLRDYLYIPLGGNRGKPWRTYFNLILTMLLGGLWHGASFTFVVWGGLHGIGLALNRAWRDWRKPGKSQPGPLKNWQRILQILLTFHFVCAAWIFFRAESFKKAAQIFQVLSDGTLQMTNLSMTLLLTLQVGLISHFVPERMFQSLKTSFCHLPFYVQGALLFLVAIALRTVASSDEVPFVYFQF